MSWKIFCPRPRAVMGWAGAISLLISTGVVLRASEDDCHLRDRAAEAGERAVVSPDFFETNPDGSLPAPDKTPAPVVANALAPAATQPLGALTGKIVFTSGGHGWTYANGDESITRWYTQRGVVQEMNEDYGNMDQMTLFAYYCFNAGATVVPIRPVGHQTNEVVLDNVSPSVTWSGSWTDSSSTLYYGKAGQTPYRFASIAATETATATYTPTIPVTGFYPVYAWTRHGSDRTSQLYRIRHTGGESQVRIPHDMAGNGWIYLGSYYFNAGSNSVSGAVVISNLRPTPTYGSIVVADAIRFGNGMGDVVPTPKTNEVTTVSSYPREEEASRYWVQRAVGQGQSTTIYNTSSDDNSDNVGTPPRTAREMNRGESGEVTDRVFVGFHSNAGGGRGCVGLYNDGTLFPGTSTPHQQRLALLVSTEVDSDMKVLPLEVAWSSRSSLAAGRSDYAFGEIRGDSISQEMDATILEVAFHDEVSDAKLLRDPKVRNWIARGAYQGIMRYFGEFDTNFVVNYLPEPPANVRAVATNTGIALAWNVPIASRRSMAPTNYVIYRSTNGFGFGNPVYVGSAATNLVLTGLPNDTDLYFRVAAINAGGESLPSEVVGCRRASVTTSPRVLVVNAFTRLDRFTNLRHTPNTTNWKPPGNSGTMERVLPRSNNSFDYVVQHGQAISAAGMAFDACSQAAVANGLIKLTNYSIVVWAAGQELAGGISSLSQTQLTAFLLSNGGLFVSGSELTAELGKTNSPAASRTFFQNQLHATLLANENATNAGSYALTTASGGVFNGIVSANVDDGTKSIYWVKSPDVLVPNGTGTRAALNYSGGLGGAAAVQYDGSAGGGRVVYLGFPFETVTLAARRNSYMAAALNFLSTPPPAGSPVIGTGPASQTVNRYADVTFSVTASGQAPLLYQWRFNNNLLNGETNSSLTLLNVQTNQAGGYSVVVSNALSSAPSGTATLTVNIPLVTNTFFADAFETAPAGGAWITNKTSTDTRVTFNYNYTGDSIPVAPRTTNGTKLGVKFEANLTNKAVAAICISPAGKTFTGDFDLRFDMWINANGTFPNGGAGSTEHLTAGVSTTGTNVQWGGAGTAASGTWFAVDGEGQAGGTGTISDFLAYSATTQQATNSGVYAAGTDTLVRGSAHPYYAGTFPQGRTPPAAQAVTHTNQTGALAAGAVGLKWCDVRIAKRTNQVTWFIDGLKIATVTNGNAAGSNIFVGYWDAFSSVSTNPAMSFGLVDNLRVEQVTEALLPALTVQPVSRTVVQGSNVLFTVTATGTTNFTYQWQREGDAIPGATASSYTVTNAQPSQEGDYSVIVSNVAGRAISTNAALVVVVPPSIATPPEDQVARAGDTAEFSVEAAGTGPLGYQWHFNSSPLGGATDSSLTLTNVQSGQAGGYRVVVTNLAGSVTSAIVSLTVELPLPLRFEPLAWDENGRPQLVLRGAPGRTYTVQLSTNLIAWENVTNLVVDDEAVAEWVDLAATNAVRFYRAVEVP